MDNFTILVSLVVMILAMQYNMGWLLFGTAVIVILSMRSLTATILMLAAIAAIYIFQGDLKDYSLYIMLGVMVISMLIDKKQKPEQSDMYGADMSGLGGLGGMGGEGGF